MMAGAEIARRIPSCTVYCVRKCAGMYVYRRRGLAGGVHALCGTLCMPHQTAHACCRVADGVAFHTSGPLLQDSLIQWAMAVQQKVAAKILRDLVYVMTSCLRQLLLSSLNSQVSSSCAMAAYMQQWGYAYVLQSIQARDKVPTSSPLATSIYSYILIYTHRQN